MTSRSPKMYAYADLADGTSYAGLLVPMSAKFAWERTAKARGWDTEANPFTFSAYMAWHAGKTAGRHALTWEQFAETATDAGIVDEPPEHADAAPADPTTPATPGRPEVSTGQPLSPRLSPASPPIGG